MNTFQDLKEQIKEKLPSILVKLNEKEAGFTLIEGFVSLPIQQNTMTYNIGGQTLPMIAVVGNSSGMMYFFALKKVLPDLDTTKV